MKIENLLTQFNGKTFSNNKEATEYLRKAIQSLLQEVGEKLVSEIDKDILSQTIMLNWLRSNTDMFENGDEHRFNEILKEFIKDIIKKTLQDYGVKV